jgi:hypothetical protein
MVRTPHSVQHVARRGAGIDDASDSDVASHPHHKCESARESVGFLDESAVVTLYAASLSALSTSSGHRNLSVLLLPCESINSNGNGHESAPRDNALIVGAKFCDEFVLGTHLQAERTRGRIKLPASHAFGFFYEQVGTPRLFGLLSC